MVEREEDANRLVGWNIDVDRPITRADLTAFTLSCSSTSASCTRGGRPSAGSGSALRLGPLGWGSAAGVWGWLMTSMLTRITTSHTANKRQRRTERKRMRSGEGWQCGVQEPVAVEQNACTVVRCDAGGAEGLWSKGCRCNPGWPIAGRGAYRMSFDAARVLGVYHVRDNDSPPRWRRESARMSGACPQHLSHACPPHHLQTAPCPLRGLETAAHESPLPSQPASRTYGSNARLAHLAQVSLAAHPPRLHPRRYTRVECTPDDNARHQRFGTDFRVSTSSHGKRRRGALCLMSLPHRNTTMASTRPHPPHAGIHEMAEGAKM